MAKRSFKLINAAASGAAAEINNLSAAVIWANVPDANITQSSVTQHQTSLSILESQILDGSILARLAANETITGAWDFAAITATSYDGILAANLLDKTTFEIVTGRWDFESDGSAPQLCIVDSDSNGAATRAFIEFLGKNDVLTGRMGYLSAGSGIFTIDNALPNAGIELTNAGVQKLRIDINGIFMSDDTDVAGAITATSYGGITEANLLDKTAVESITGAWTLPVASITDHEAALSILQPQVTIAITAAETSAGVTPVDLTKKPVNVLRYGINTVPGTTDMTTAIQNAHLVSTTGNYETVVFDAGDYLFTTLTWSPHVRAITTGKVYLRTANASGRTIHISDEYGLPTVEGLNAARNFVFDGQFFVINTNGANTATAWAFGGLAQTITAGNFVVGKNYRILTVGTTDFTLIGASSNTVGVFFTATGVGTGTGTATQEDFCIHVTPLRGVETRGFHGGVYEFLNNAALLDFVDCFEFGNNGNVINIADPITNTGEDLLFINHTFGTSDDGFLVDVNTVDIISLEFIGCSCDFKQGMNKTGNTAVLLGVNWQGGHIEWNQVTNAYLQNDSKSTWNIDGAYFTDGATSGFPTTVISTTSNGSFTRIINARYGMPGGTNIWHTISTALDTGIFDYTPNTEGGSAPTTFINQNADAVVGRTGITYEQGTWTPVLTFTTPGDLVVVHAAQTGKYVRIGNQVTVTCNLQTSTFTHTTAGGVLQINGLPFTVNSAGAEGGCGRSRGWTKAGYTDINVQMRPSQSFARIAVSGSGKAPGNLVPADMPTGGTVQFVFTATYFLT